MKIDEQKDGGPAFGGAFDVALIDPEGGHPPQKLELRVRGMSLRDYFAAEAMNGLCHATNDQGDWTFGDPANVSKVSYEIADAMLAARSN